MFFLLDDFCLNQLFCCHRNIWHDDCWYFNVCIDENDEDVIFPKKGENVVGSFNFSYVVCSICSIYSFCFTAICKFNRTL